MVAEQQQYTLNQHSLLCCSSVFFSYPQLVVVICTSLFIVYVHVLCLHKVLPIVLLVLMGSVVVAQVLTVLIILLVLIFLLVLMAGCMWVIGRQAYIAHKTFEVKLVMLVLMTSPCYNVLTVFISCDCTLKHQPQLSLSPKYTTQIHNCIVSWQYARTASK